MIEELLKEGHFIEKVEQGIFTTIGNEARVHEYDNKAKQYDALIGSNLYNRIVWGNKLTDYKAFCQNALASKSTGYVLDAGCGSLVFTGEVYAQYRVRPLILLDRSLGMLRRAKSRLESLNGKVPDNIILVQGDVLALPFREGVFETVQSFGMLHIFEDTQKFIQALLKVKSESGTLFFNSLVGNNWFGRNYLKALMKAGEVAKLQTSTSLNNNLSTTGLNFTTETIGNMAYFSYGS